MIAVKKPKKGEKVKKNDEAAYYDDEVPTMLDISQKNVGPGRMKRQSEKINEMSNFEQDRLLDAGIHPTNPGVSPFAHQLDDFGLRDHAERLDVNRGKNSDEDGVMSHSDPTHNEYKDDRHATDLSGDIRGLTKPPGMSDADYRRYIERINAMVPTKPAPGKDFMSRLVQRRGNRGTVILDGRGGNTTGDAMQDHLNRIAARNADLPLRNIIQRRGNRGQRTIRTGEPMDLAWRLLKGDLEEQYMLENLTAGGNYPEKGPHIPQFAFRNDVTNNQTANTPPPLNWMKRPGVAKPTKEEILANQGFTPENIKAQQAKNAAAAAALRAQGELHQPKGG